MKNSIKKLSLNKMTISNLNAVTMNQVVGGADGGQKTGGLTLRKNTTENQTSRCTQLSICC